MIYFIVLLAGVLFLGCFYLVFQRRLVASILAVFDVTALIRQVDEREVEELTDEVQEKFLIANSPLSLLKKRRRARAGLLLEYLERMGFNALVFLLWAYAERRKLERPGMPEDQAKGRAIGEVIDAGIAFRAYLLGVFPSLLWLLFLDEVRISSLRSLANLRRSIGIEGPAEYRRLTTSAIALATAIGLDTRNKLTLLLRQNIPNS